MNFELIHVGNYLDNFAFKDILTVSVSAYFQSKYILLEYI